MRLHENRREGFALATAIVAIVVIGALIAGAFFSSTQEFRVGRNALVQQRAFSSAEFGLNNAIDAFDRTRNMTMPVGSTDVLPFVSTGTEDGARVRITRLNKSSYWIVSTGFAAANSPLEIQRRVSAVVRTTMPSYYAPGALTTAQGVSLGGNSGISGVDNNPNTGNAWNCSSVQNGDMPAVAAPPGTTVSVSGSATLTTGPGQDTVIRDSNVAADSTYTQFGDLNWQQLTSTAQVRITGGDNFTFAPGPPTGMTYRDWEVDGRCVNDQRNWGDVSRPAAGDNTSYPCRNYFPTIYVNGSIKLNGGSGQGTLLIDGDLEMAGDFTFYGMVIVRGRIFNRGGGSETSHLIGSVMARDATLESNSFRGHTQIQLSTCATEWARMANAVMTVARERGWAELF